MAGDIVEFRRGEPKVRRNTLSEEFIADVEMTVIRAVRLVFAKPSTVSAELLVPDRDVKVSVSRAEGNLIRVDIESTGSARFGALRG